MKLTVQFADDSFVLEMSSQQPITFQDLKQRILEKATVLTREPDFQLGLNSSSPIIMNSGADDISADLGIVSGDKIYVFDLGGQIFKCVQSIVPVGSPECPVSDKLLNHNVLLEAQNEASEAPALVQVGPSISEDIFVRPSTVFTSEQRNGLTFLWESTDDKVPASFQKAWAKLCVERKGNVSMLDGFLFVLDTLMWEEGFQKLKDPHDDDRETVSVRRSYYSHLADPSSGETYSCMVVLSSQKLRNEQHILIQPVLQEEFRKKLRLDPRLSFKIPSTTRYWISNAYSGSIRNNVVEMYRNLPELAILLKDNIVFKLKAIIGHGLDPPVLVGLDSLPELVIEKLILMARIKDVVSLAQTCKLASDVLRWEQVWKHFAKREFPAFQKISDEEMQAKHGTWREAFVAGWSKRATIERTARRQRELGTGYFQPPWYLVPAVNEFPFSINHNFDEDNF